MYGTLTTLDDIRNLQDSINAFGEDQLAERIARSFNFHNSAMQEAVADFATLTSERQHGYGGGADIELQEMDQNGTPDAQKVAVEGNLGLPLRFFGAAVQWNRHFVVNTSVAKAIEQLDAAAAADVRNVTRQIRRALFTPTNNDTYQDRLQTPIIQLQLKALLNADGMGIPMGPNGETFDGSSHTHYVANASLTESFLSSLVDNVLEHGVSGGMAIYINRAQEATVRGFDGFEGYVDARINTGANESYATGGLDVNNPADRAIGIFNGAEVWVKPWVPANYQVVFDRGAGVDKALGIRTRSGSMGGDAYSGGFGLLFEDDTFPLRARALGREFGVGVLNRHKAAVGYTGGAEYVMPSLEGGN